MEASQRRWLLKNFSRHRFEVPKVEWLAHPAEGILSRGELLFSGTRHHETVPDLRTCVEQGTREWLGRISRCNSQVCNDQVVLAFPGQTQPLFSRSNRFDGIAIRREQRGDESMH